MKPISFGLSHQRINNATNYLFPYLPPHLPPLTLSVILYTGKFELIPVSGEFIALPGTTEIVMRIPNKPWPREVEFTLAALAHELGHFYDQLARGWYCATTDTPIEELSSDNEIIYKELIADRIGFPIGKDLGVAPEYIILSLKIIPKLIRSPHLDSSLKRDLANMLAWFVSGGNGPLPVLTYKSDLTEPRIDNVDNGAIIANTLGIIYNGPQLDLNRGFLFHTFTDPLTHTTFAGHDLDDTSKKLIETRARFGIDTEKGNQS